MYSCTMWQCLRNRINSTLLVTFKERKIVKTHTHTQSALDINTSLHSDISTDKQLIKENTRIKENSATENEKYTITKHSRKKGKDYKKIKPQQSGKDMGINKSISLNPQYYGATPEINCKIKQELYEKGQNSNDNTVQTTSGGKSSKNETKTPLRHNLPKIIANCVLPRVRIEKL